MKALRHRPAQPTAFASQLDSARTLGEFIAGNRLATQSQPDANVIATALGTLLA
ncbi:hypothetical protein C8D87_114156 [Lentzea atacamensis]|uniref:Uncharacterized protein n=1 Tax=Lentzea atacamensis TaxID=531938 RepID=A0ABX9DW77_9PSEU|nr:hypothetical protein C8D87_114156 [Lentzea atacamensis]